MEIKLISCSGEKLKKCDRCDLHHLRRAISTAIWKHIVEKSQTNATSVTLHPLMQALWGHIWKHTVKKIQTNVRRANVLQPSQAGNLWGHPYFGANYTKLVWGSDSKLLEKLHNFQGKCCKTVILDWLRIKNYNSTASLVLWFLSFRRTAISCCNWLDILAVSVVRCQRSEWNAENTCIQMPMIPAISN